MIFFVYLKMVRKIFDATAQQGNLNLRGSRILFIHLELLNNFFFNFRR